ncbi:hypothetical protein PLICRDRAFT_177350 [Plicaturopsis crispa FD-325 SS-3]|nr:hypothetical protein PLICRDRAFT_177350 [Plicaturopsis crispa FD-325 SS-3]
MSTIALAKVPFLLAVASAVHVTVTPPNPPPAPSESRVPDEAVLVKIMPWGNLLAKSVYWALSLTEVAVILADAYPSSKVSQVVLSKLAQNASSQSIRITSTFLLASLATVAGGIIRRICYRTLGEHFTFQLSVRKEQKLVTWGPYSVVRHPSYAGAILVGMGAAIAYLSPGSWLRECSGLFPLPPGIIGSCIRAAGWLECAVIAWLFWLRVRSEDEMLRKEFGQAWEDWRRAVPWNIFPGIY